MAALAMPYCAAAVPGWHQAIKSSVSETVLQLSFNRCVSISVESRNFPQVAVEHRNNSRDFGCALRPHCTGLWVRLNGTLGAPLPFILYTLYHLPVVVAKTVNV
jgi:hypothetical protein